MAGDLRAAAMTLRRVGIITINDALALARALEEAAAMGKSALTADTVSIDTIAGLVRRIQTRGASSLIEALESADCTKTTTIP